MKGRISRLSVEPHLHKRIIFPTLYRQKPDYGTNSAVKKGKVMVNLILGLITGIVGTLLFLKGTTQAWYVWALFILGAASIIFSFDVLIGSIKEHEKRAALLGFLMFVVPGAALMGASLVLGF